MAAKICEARVGLRGDSDRADDLALLVPELPLNGRPYLRFEAALPEDTFLSLGFPKPGPDQPERREQVRGAIGLETDPHDWLGIVTTGPRKITPGFSGTAVWVEKRKAVVGLINRYRVRGEAFAITAAQIRAFLPGPSLDNLRKQCNGFVTRAEGHLQEAALRDLIFEAAPEKGWELVAGKASRFAEELCLRTGPEELAEVLSHAFVKIYDQGQPEKADQVFDVLLNALPAALVSQWQLPVPPADDARARLEIATHVLAELALAVAEEGVASFHLQLDKGLDQPRATHCLPLPGELGLDLAGEEAASELGREAARRLAFDCDESKSNVHEYLGDIATRRLILGQGRLIDKADLDQTPEESRGALLDQLNDLLALRTVSGQRRFYFLDTVSGDPNAASEEKAVVERLKELLSNLKIVTLDPSREQSRLARMLLHPIKAIFVRRSRRPT